MNSSEQEASHAQMEAASVDFGFASFKDGSFELIVRDRNTWEETTLCGTLADGQFEIADRILPTCVFVAAAPRSPAEGVCQNENCDFANMLWAWFEDESRVGKDGMRPERHEGLSSDDFKSMLDEHEAALVHDIERLTETNSQLLAQVEDAHRLLREARRFIEADPTALPRYPLLNQIRAALTSTERPSGAAMIDAMSKEEWLSDRSDEKAIVGKSNTSTVLQPNKES